MQRVYVEVSTPEFGSDKALKVHSMFGAIAKRYDTLNSLLSFGLDRLWRIEAAKLALEHNPYNVLDVATGTADLAICLKRYQPNISITAVDFVEAMLKIASKKVAKHKLDICLEQADGLNLPYANESFDAVTIAYGLRNFADYKKGLKEFYRVLKPRGRLVVLEFPPPPKGVFGQLFRFYFLKIVPLIGGLLSGKLDAYNYLPQSVLNFPSPAELAELMHEVGFKKVDFQPQTFCVSGLHIADKY